jgi:hypothetical protein
MTNFACCGVTRGVEKFSDLTSVFTTNMHAFDANIKLRKFLTVHDVLTSSSAS